MTKDKMVLSGLISCNNACIVSRWSFSSTRISNSALFLKIAAFNRVLPKSKQMVTDIEIIEFQI